MLRSVGSHGYDGDDRVFSDPAALVPGSRERIRRRCHARRMGVRDGNRAAIARDAHGRGAVARRCGDRTEAKHEYARKESTAHAVCSLVVDLEPDAGALAHRLTQVPGVFPARASFCRLVPASRCDARDDSLLAVARDLDGTIRGKTPQSPAHGPTRPPRRRRTVEKLRKRPRADPLVTDRPSLVELGEHEPLHVAVAAAHPPSCSTSTSRPCRGSTLP